MSWARIDQNAKALHMRVIISAATTKLSIAITVASIVFKNERKEITVILPVFSSEIILRAVKKIMLRASITARSRKIKIIRISYVNQLV